MWSFQKTVIHTKLHWNSLFLKISKNKFISEELLQPLEGLLINGQDKKKLLCRSQWKYNRENQSEIKGGKQISCYNFIRVNLEFATQFM